MDIEIHENPNFEAARSAVLLAVVGGLMMGH